MKRLLTAVAAVAALALIPTEAAAGPIVIDPIIGVRGLDIGSTASNNSDFVNMGGCQSDLNSFFGAGNVFCESYYIVSPVSPPISVDSDYVPSSFFINSLTFRFADAGGGIVNPALFPDTDREGYEASGLNEFNGFSRSLVDPFEITLSLTGESFFSCGINTPSTEFHTTCFQVYLAIPQNETVNGPYSVSLTAINGVQQDPTLASVPVVTPEPASLLLFGLGVAAVAGRRRRQRTAS